MLLILQQGSRRSHSEKSDEKPDLRGSEAVDDFVGFGIVLFGIVVVVGILACAYWTGSYLGSIECKEELEAQKLMAQKMMA